MLSETLEKIARREDLGRREMSQTIGAVVDADCPPAQIAGLLMGLRVKGETVDELVGAAAAFRERAVPVPLNEPADLDTAGTGGDGKGSLNLSTAAALVASAAGLTVAKHGNRSVSSRCGSADLLETLGIPVDHGPSGVASALTDTGFGFLFAPNYHPAMKAVAPIRKTLGVRTLFNLLGPLTNPAGVRAQLVGVYHPSKADMLAAALAAGGVARALVVSSECGLDEVAPLGITHVVEVRDGRLARYSVTPEDFGLAPAPLDSIKGGDPDENARLVRGVLEGDSLPARTGILLNAAAALVAAGAAEDFRDGAELAAETIDSGRAAAKLEMLAQPDRRAA